MPRLPEKTKTSRETEKSLGGYLLKPSLKLFSWLPLEG